MRRPLRTLATFASAVLLSTALAAQPAHAADATVTADFAVSADYPLVKSKFGLFNSGYVSLARWERDAAKMAALRPARVRWETMWGNEQHDWTPMVTGSPDDPQYHFEQIDRLADLINDAGAQPVPALTYTPGILKPPGGNWNDPPTDPSVWATKIVPALAAHWKETGRRVGSYEIWNEPTCPACSGPAPRSSTSTCTVTPPARCAPPTPTPTSKDRRCAAWGGRPSSSTACSPTTCRWTVSPSTPTPTPPTAAWRTTTRRPPTRA
jgi:hypothetical protein